MLAHITLAHMRSERTAHIRENQNNKEICSRIKCVPAAVVP